MAYKYSASRKKQVASYKNARGKGRVAKYCMNCRETFYGPPGGFKRIPEPGLCEKCKRPYEDNEYYYPDDYPVSLSGVCHDRL